jgi:hypothetical protein
MKKLWNTLSFLAVVNLLAVGMLLAWLWKTGRIDRDRLLEIKTMLATTVADETEATEAEIAAAAAAESTEAMTSAAHGRQMTRLTERDYLAMQRLEDERRMLRQQLDDAADQLTAQDVAARAEQDEWLRQHADLEATAGDTQFTKAVRHVESLPPKQGKAFLEELIARGEIDRAIMYLDAMAPRPASKVLREFKTAAEAKVATELLEGLGRLGLESEEGTPDAQRSADTSAPARGDQADQGSAPAGSGRAAGSS